MENDADRWKIANVTGFWDTENDIPFDSLYIKYFVIAVNKFFVNIFAKNCMKKKAYELS